MISSPARRPWTLWSVVGSSICTWVEIEIAALSNDPGQKQKAEKEKKAKEAEAEAKAKKTQEEPEDEDEDEEPDQKEEEAEAIVQYFYIVHTDLCFNMQGFILYI